MSPDGARLAVAIRRVDGTSELQVHAIGAVTEPLRVENGSRPAFSSDSEWLAYQIGYSEDEQERLRDRNEPLRNKMALVNLASDATELIDAVQSFTFNDTGAFLAMRSYAAEGQDSADLVIRDLAAGTTINFGNVASFAWHDDGVLLAMTIGTESGTGNGVQLYDAASGSLRVLDSGDATFRRLAWRDKSDDLAVLRSTEDEVHEDPTHVVLAWRGLVSSPSGPTELRFDHRETDGFPAGMRSSTAHRAGRTTAAPSSSASMSGRRRRRRQSTRTQPPTRPRAPRKQLRATKRSRLQPDAPPPSPPTSTCGMRSMSALTRCRSCRRLATGKAVTCRCDTSTTTLSYS